MGRISHEKEFIIISNETSKQSILLTLYFRIFCEKIEEEEFEDTKREIRIRKWKKDRQSEEIR